MSPLGFRLGRLPLCKRLQLHSIIHECVGVGIEDSALLPLPLPHYAFLFPVISLLSCILTFLRAKFHPRGLLSSGRGESTAIEPTTATPFVRFVRPRSSDEPEMAHVFLRHRRRRGEYSFLAHDADERFARCLSLARILPPSLSGAAATMICREISTKRSGENNNNSNGTLARTHPLPCSSW